MRRVYYSDRAGLYVSVIVRRMLYQAVQETYGNEEENNMCRQFLSEEDGVGVIEIILVLVVIFILPWLIWK